MNAATQDAARRFAAVAADAITLVVSTPIPAGLTAQQIADELDDRCDLVSERLGLPGGFIRGQVSMAIAMRLVIKGKRDMAFRFLASRGGARVAESSMAEIDDIVARCER